MSRKVEYTGKEPEVIFVVKTDDHFRTFISEGFALIYLDRLLRSNKQAEIISYLREDKKLVSMEPTFSG